MVKQIKIGKIVIVGGISKQLGLGFNIFRYSASVDFLCLWVSVEW